MADPNGERRERERKATDLAYAKGVEAAALNARLAEYDRHFTEFNGSLGRLTDTVAALDRRLDVMERCQDKRDAIQEATVAAAREQTKAQRAATARQVSTRQFYIGLASTVAAFGGLLQVSGNG